MSIRKVTTQEGRVRWVVRWYEAGRRGARRQATFDSKADAQYFEASVRRAMQLGHLAAELRGSTQTVREFIDEWWEK